LRKHSYKDKLSVIKERLWQWAEYMLEPIPGLSYSSTTIEYRLMIEGANGGNSTPQARVPRYRPHPREAEVNRSLQELTKRQLSIIHLTYITRTNYKEISKELDISVRTYMRDNKKAHEIIGKYIGLSL